MTLLRKSFFQVEEWKNTCNILCMPVDDFKLILEIDFFLKVKKTMLLHLDGLIVLEERQPYFRHALKGKTVGKG